MAVTGFSNDKVSSTCNFTKENGEIMLLNIGAASPKRIGCT